MELLWHLKWMSTSASHFDDKCLFLIVIISLSSSRVDTVEPPSITEIKINNSKTLTDLHVTVKPGSKNNFSCTAEGDAPLKVTWKVGGVMIDQNKKNDRIYQQNFPTDNHSMSVLYIRPTGGASTWDSGVYTCVATNGDTLMAFAMLTVTVTDEETIYISKQSFVAATVVLSSGLLILAISAIAGFLWLKRDNMRQNNRKFPTEYIPTNEPTPTNSTKHHTTEDDLYSIPNSPEILNSMAIKGTTEDRKISVAGGNHYQKQQRPSHAFPCQINEEGRRFSRVRGIFQQNQQPINQGYQQQPNGSHERYSIANENHPIHNQDQTNAAFQQQNKSIYQETITPSDENLYAEPTVYGPAIEGLYEQSIAVTRR